MQNLKLRERDWGFTAGFNKIDHLAERLGAEFDSQIAIERRGHAALLHVTDYAHACREHALALLAQQTHYELGRVVLVGHLVAQQKAAFEVALHFELEMSNVVDEVVDGEFLLVDVGLVGACS